MAFQLALAHITGVDPSYVVSHSDSWDDEFKAVVHIWLIDEQNMLAIRELVDGVTLEEYQARLDAQLAALGVPLHELQLNVTYCCRLAFALGGFEHVCMVTC